MYAHHSFLNISPSFLHGYDVKMPIFAFDGEHKGDGTRDDSQGRFLAQHSVVTLLRHCFKWFHWFSVHVPTLQRCVALKIVLPNRPV